MADRFERLFELPQNLHASDSPVVVAAGTLLKDTQTGSIIAQLKFQNVSPQNIKAVKLSLAAFDITGLPLNEVEYQYLDLNISNGECFGSNKAIVIPDKVARRVEINKITIVLEDGEHQVCGTDLAPIPEQKPLSSELSDELVQEYKQYAGTTGNSIPVSYDAFWLCACGTLNTSHTCTRCYAKKENVFKAYNPSILSKQLQARKEAEEADRLERERLAELEREKAQKRAKRIKKIGIVVAAIALVVVIASVLVTKVIIPNGKYNDAIALMDAGKYTEAIAAFDALDGYKDSESCAQEARYAQQYADAESLFIAGRYDDAYKSFEALGNYLDSKVRADEAYAAKLAEEKAAAEAAAAALEMENKNAYTAAETLLKQGKTLEAAIAFGKIADYKDARARSLALWTSYGKNQTVAFGFDHIIALKEDGTVVAAGSNEDGQCNVSGWKDIVSVYADDYVSIGLKADGTVCLAGSDINFDDSISSWTDIVAISTDGGDSIGLKLDGTVVASYYFDADDEVAEWANIVAISTGVWADHAIGLTVDGRVVGAGYSREGQIDVYDWSSIVDIGAGEECSVGLKADGTVIAIGSNRLGQTKANGWRNIVAISTASCATIGLKPDGTVIGAGRGTHGQLAVSDWTDIAAIQMGAFNSAGIKSDGTLIVIGENEDGVCEASGWKDIKLPNWSRTK